MTTSIACSGGIRRRQRYQPRLDPARDAGAATVRGVRVATWNVNSVKQRLPRLLPWLDERRPDVVCLQETKLADDAFDELLAERAASGAATRSPATARCSGTASRSSRAPGSRTSSSGIPGAPGFPHAEARAVAATCGGVRVHSRVRAERARPRLRALPYKLAWLAALRDDGRRRPEAAIVCGDMNIAPADADVFDPEAYVGQTHVTPPERDGAGAPPGARPARRRPRALAGRARLHLLGLPRRHVPPGPRHAHRPRARERAGRRPGRARRGSTARRARAPARAITRR